MKLHIFHLEGDEKPWVVAIKSEDPPNPIGGNQVLISFGSLEAAKQFKEALVEGLSSIVD